MKTQLITCLMLSIATAFIPMGLFSIPMTVHAAEQKASRDFDGVGVLDDIRSDGVVINDIYHRLAPGVEFKSPDAKSFTQASFRSGDTVGFFKDEKNHIVVLWRLQ